MHDWHVPVALIDFQKLKDANWDITASKVSIKGVWMRLFSDESTRSHELMETDATAVLQICQYIDGVQHVERIAQLADADLDSVRSCIQHFLYVSKVSERSTVNELFAVADFGLVLCGTGTIKSS